MAALSDPAAECRYADELCDRVTRAHAALEPAHAAAVAATKRLEAYVARGEYGKGSAAAGEEGDKAVAREGAIAIAQQEAVDALARAVTVLRAKRAHAPPCYRPCPTTP